MKGWREATRFTAEEVIQQFEACCSGFLCTCVDREGMMQGADLNWFHRLRDATDLEITAAGGITTLEDIKTLDAMQIHSALGIASYAGRLDLAQLAIINSRLRQIGDSKLERRRGDPPARSAAYAVPWINQEFHSKEYAALGAFVCPVRHIVSVPRRCFNGAAGLLLGAR